MSTQNVITLSNLPTETALIQSFNAESIKLYKHLKYEVGCIDTDKMRNMMRLSKFICNGGCYLDDEQDQKVRETLIVETINQIYEL